MAESGAVTCGVAYKMIEPSQQDTGLIVYNAMRTSLGLSLVQGATVEDFAALAPQVTALRLSNLELAAVPPEVFFLANLQRLDLSGNRLRGLPQEMRFLSQLEVLDASCNQITEFPLLPMVLKKVYLRGNQIPTVPDLSDYAMTVIDLERNRVRFSYESVFPSTVETLMLSENHIDALPNMGDLTALKVLLLNKNSLTALPDSMEGLSIRKLELSQNGLTAIPFVISSLASLLVLHLKNNKITSVPEWADSLDELCLEGNPIESAS